MYIYWYNVGSSFLCSKIRFVPNYKTLEKVLEINFPEHKPNPSPVTAAFCVLKHDSVRDPGAGFGHEAQNYLILECVA